MSGLAMGTAGSDGAAGVAGGGGSWGFGGPSRGREAHGVGSPHTTGQALTTAVHRGRGGPGKAPTTLCIGGDQHALRAPHVNAPVPPTPPPPPDPREGRNSPSPGGGGGGSCRVSVRRGDDQNAVESPGLRIPLPPAPFTHPPAAGAAAASPARAPRRRPPRFHPRSSVLPGPPVKPRPLRLSPSHGHQAPPTDHALTP